MMDPFEDVQADDDNSETWSLPNWSELENARRARKRRMARIRRARLRRAAAASAHLTPQGTEENPTNEAGELLAAVNSTISLQDQELDLDEDEDDLPEDMKNRGTWNNSVEFVMSLISMSVGLGNFYRFPFVAYKNGGGAFLLPYLLVLTFVARPMYFMELALGQFCSYGQVKCWEMAPFFRGVGYGSALGCFAVVTYYSSVMGVTLFYFYNSFRTVLPWSVCDPEWAGEETCQKILNMTNNNDSIDPRTVVNLPQLYFAKKVMREADGIEDGIGLPQDTQTIFLFVSWILIFLVIIKGVQSTGKVAYFTTIYPYLIIFVMLIAACTKDGAADGMLYFLKPDWSRMADPKVWFAATGQCFFSLNTGFGPIVNYASYNPVHHPIYRDTFIVSVMDTLASVMAGLTVFGTLGTISLRLNKPISEVVDDGPGLVFVSFSDAIANFAYAPQLLSILFFSMLLALAVGSAVALQLACIEVIYDQFPKSSKFVITVTSCVAGFLISLIYVTPGGQFMLTLVDNFGGTVNIYILATLESIGIAYVYGLNNFCDDIRFMLNKKVGLYWRLCWGFVVPVLLTVVMIYTFATTKRLIHNGHQFPDSAIACGWLLTGISLIFIPIGAVYGMYRSTGTLKERFLNTLRPTAEFGPRRPHDKERWILFKKGIIAKGGPPPDTFQLPEGQTPEHNTLPDWLIVNEHGKVYPKEDHSNSVAAEQLQAISNANNFNGVRLPYAISGHSAIRREI